MADLIYPAKVFDCYAGTLSLTEMSVARDHFGYQGMIHYYGGSQNKDLNRVSALGISSLGMWCGAVYEVGGAEFSGAQGTLDANDALGHAAAVGQPAGSAIYFAVDTGIGATPAILAHFGSVAATVKPAGYKVGVYGPGEVCAALKKLGLVDFTWLGGAMGWPGSRAYLGQEDILQGLPHNVQGVTDVDDDTVHHEAGLFQVAA